MDELTMSEQPLKSLTVRRHVWVWFYLVAVPVSSGLSAWLLALAAGSRRPEEVLAFAWIPMVLAMIGIPMLIWKSWAAIQDGRARTTPGKALLFSLIPIFNLYWFFQVWHGFAIDYNAYLDRYGLRRHRLSPGLYLAFCIVTLAYPTLYGWIIVDFSILLLMAAVLAGLLVLALSACVTVENCRAINQLAEREAEPGRESLTGDTAVPADGQAMIPSLVAGMFLGIFGGMLLIGGGLGMAVNLLDYASYQRSAARASKDNDPYYSRQVREYEGRISKCLGAAGTGGLIGTVALSLLIRRRKVMKTNRTGIGSAAGLA